MTDKRCPKWNDKILVMSKHRTVLQTQTCLDVNMINNDFTHGMQADKIFENGKIHITIFVGLN